MKFKNNTSVLDQYSSSNISKIAFFLLGIILLSVSSKVSIPFYPVPMTFQTFVVYFIAASMGMVGFYSTLTYVVLGLMGLPVFAAGGGIGYLLSPTFGFLYGMVLASLAIAYFSKNLFSKKITKIALVLFAGAIITFVCGIVHLAGFIGLEKAVMAGLVPFIYSELLKIALAVFSVYLLIKKN
jgi:biotin transport system substrate-specific component